MDGVRAVPVEAAHEPRKLEWEVVAACEVGVTHRRLKGPCEDAWSAASGLDGTLILAVADGAGSAARPAEGSQLAVQAVREAIARRLEPPPQAEAGWTQLLLDALREVREVFEVWVAAEHEAGRFVRLRDASTTLLVAVLTAEWLAALQLGDGAIVVQDAGGRLSTLTTPYHGAFAGETVFVTSRGYLDKADCAVMPSEQVQGIALLTDGLEPLGLNLATLTPHPPFFAPLFAFAKDASRTPFDKAIELSALLTSERICARTHDDKTLLLAVRR